MLRSVGSLILVLSVAASVSGESRFGGTFIGAIIAEDGIIVASDSRSTFEDADRKAVGYIDGMTKIFVQQGAAFAVSGLTSVNDELFPAFVRRNEFLLARPVHEVLHGVAVWLPFRNSTNVLLISAGYVNGEPTICARGPNSAQTCRTSGFVINQAAPGLNSWYSQLKGARLKAQDAAQAIRGAILERAAADRTVGGPISILHLRKDAPPVWLENEPGRDHWLKVCDLVNDHRRLRPLISFTNSKEELDRYLAGVCPK